MSKKNRKMGKKVTSAIAVTLLVTSVLTLTLCIQRAKGWSGTVTIRADGSISPLDAPVSSSDNITYTLVGSIVGSIFVLRDNIVIDGSGFTLQGTGDKVRGIDLSGRTNVTVQNAHVKGFHYGVWLSESYGNTIIGNDITANDYHGVLLEHSCSNVVELNNIMANNYHGVVLEQSFNNVVRLNNITANEIEGIELLSSECNSMSGNTIADSRLGIFGTASSSYNVINGNNITNNDVGIGFYDSSNYNSVYGNNITDGFQGIEFGRSSGNSVYRNFFINNYRHAYIEPSGYANSWDKGYYSGGNFWSNYNGSDSYRNQGSSPGSDGIGDTPYIIDGRNADYYPLTSFAPIVDVGSPMLHITNPRHGEVIMSSVATVSWEGFDYGIGISHYKVIIDDKYWFNVGNDESYTFTELDNGQHVLRIAAFDRAGNAVYRLLDFSTDDGTGFVWSPYKAGALVMVAVVIALGIAIYVLRSRYPSSISKPSRKLVR